MCAVHKWMQIRVTCMNGCRCILRLPLYASAPIRTTKKWQQQKKQKKMATSNVVSLVLSAITASAATCKKEQIIYKVIFVFDTGHVCGENVSVTQLTI